MKIYAVEKPDLPAFEMPERFRTEVAFFMTPGGESGVPDLAEGEYWIRLEDARQWLDDFVVRIVSPLDAAAKTELEISDDQEAWLQWIVDHEIQHIRLQSR